MKSRAGTHTLREGRRSIRNQAYFITTATHDRTPLFRDPQLASVVLNALKWLEERQKVLLAAAVLMPDHLHCIFELKSSTLPQVMHSLKSYTAKQVNAILRQTGPVWQDQYHDHAIRRAEKLQEIVNYMLNNPVRAGLVRDFHDYPFWHCRWVV